MEISELVEELGEREDVRGVALFGSRARGSARPDSDVDLYVLVEEGFWRDVGTRDGTNVEFVYSSADESREYWRARPEAFVKMWDEAQILIDKDGTLEELRREARDLAERGKAPLDQRAIGHRRFHAEDQLRAIRALRRSDAATASLVLHRLVEALSGFFFDLRREWTPAPKERLREMRKHDAAIARAFDSVYAAGGFEAQVAAAEALVTLLFKDSKGGAGFTGL